MGINPYPAEQFEVNTNTEEIRNQFDPEKGNFQEVTIAGRMMTRRIMGSASFFELQDEKGKIQVYVRRDGKALILLLIILIGMLVLVMFLVLL